MERARDAQLERLRRAIDKIAEAYESREIDRILGAKDTFYDVLLAGSGNELIGTTLRAMNTRISLLRRVSLDSNTRVKHSLDELRNILACIEARDAVATIEACRLHVQNAAKATVNRLH